MARDVRGFGFRWIVIVTAILLTLVACSSEDEDAVDGDTPDGDGEIADGDGETPDGDEDGDADAADGDGEAEEDMPSVCFGDLGVGQWEEFATGITSGTEGIAFDGLGGLFVSNKQRVLRLDAEGNFVEFAAIPDAIGMAFDQAGDLLVCSLGEEFDKDTRDGALYRVDASGNISTVLDAGTILNPNFITRTPWGSWLVSDDLVPEIWEVGDDGQAALWTDQVSSPNGMVFSTDGSILFVASTFESGNPIWSIPVEEHAAGTASILAELLEGNVANDGVAMDVEGNLYVAANVRGKIVRVTPDGQQETIVEDLMTPASLAFGQGEGFDPCSVYVTSLFGTSVYRVNLGVEGQPLYR